ncbi:MULTISPECIES: flagellar basal body-associated FliL family protein [Dehalobacter]|jgi:flagellar FliL protein|uniref:Flagellar protein FliL n=2 Tax=Dehalobacter restrictus TaxID=55583 RepID=A0A857DJY4_9FIRM|nr:MULTISPECIES: flagellar basal body-associated FliL family protein [Dehalobacter]AHF10614.1 flagellar basal body protein FliL [Dehalobacter restrictus DSM 9455]MCG1026417.1 flagellar basal body-associated FliL family protein [Dehalobacter sp.]MDJ0305998.1 flagellar basal body-associated FliL family protein [Dehalobacter sp.]OCZ52351.1 flagellar basal body protein FliL [Dehalobacter sp. TeCB1]QHA01237.1 flagellar basal body protein FliL [Dehalobacter restrictus]
MKIKSIVVPLIFMVIGAGLGVGGMIVKDKIFPGSASGTAQVEKKDTEEVGPLIEMEEEFMINLDGGGMVKTNIVLEGANKKSAEKITEKEIFLRDRIISVVGSKGIDDIRTNEGREKLKKELLTELNDVCGDQIKEVLFKNFIYD